MATASTSLSSLNRGNTLLEPDINSSRDSFVKEISCSDLKLKEVNEISDRLKEVVDIFTTKFGKPPDKIVRVPGRVNLIGEHIDYCGFPVCPMAINKGILLAVGVADSTDNFLECYNLEENLYPHSVVEDYKEKLHISLNEIGWISYILCGIQGVIDKNSNAGKFDELKKMKMVVSGNIPPCVGLSSSSALVCAGFLATCVLNNLSMTKNEMATLCAQAEHYIGTVGGGMDQAIAFNGRRGCAMLVKFNPLRLKEVLLPDGAVVIIANSLVQKNKAASNDFNTRVVECCIAGQIMAKIAKIEHWRELKTLSEVKKALDFSLSEVLVFTEKLFHDDPYTKEEICNILNVTEEELNEVSLTPNTYNVNEFKLKQRSKHVFGEAERVYTWRNWCLTGQSLKDLGGLLLKSHNSLQHLYECSHPDVDKLVSIFLMSGAYGARVTGAGWGGCVVALTTRENIPVLKANLKDMYYKSIKEDYDIDKSVFVCYPADGAEIYSV